MGLVELSAEIDQIVAHLYSRIGDLRKISVLKAELADRFIHLVVEQRVATSTLKFRQNSCAVQRDPLRASQLQEQADESKRE